eukprot:scaffold58017_cov89-Phaeocystis_antarctica.AAC.2
MDTAMYPASVRHLQASSEAFTCHKYAVQIPCTWRAHACQIPSTCTYHAHARRTASAGGPLVLALVSVVGLGFRRSCACRWSLRHSKHGHS